MHAHNKRISILKGDRGKLDNTSAAHQKTHLEKLTLSLACSGLSQASLFLYVMLLDLEEEHTQACPGGPWLQNTAAVHPVQMEVPEGLY